MESAGINSRSISMNSFFAIIGASTRWPLFKHYWASEPDTNPRPVSRYGARTTYLNCKPQSDHNMIWPAEATG